MAWDRPDDATIVFECDTCDAEIECDVAKVRSGSRETPVEWTAFSLCWRYVQGIGWRGLKRIGHDWTHHCPACGEAAQTAHDQHRLDEHARERIKARNAS